MKIPTIDEYRAEVKEHFCRHWPSLSDGEVESYLSDDEAAEKIKSDYELYKALLSAENAGEEAPVAAAGSTPSAVGYCLSMMY